MKKIKYYIALIICMTSLTVPGTFTWAEQAGQKNEKSQEDPMIKPVYPQAAAQGIDAETFLEGDLHWQWLQCYHDKVNASIDCQGAVYDYYAAIQKKLLCSSEEENAVISPLNIYFALSMLAEISEGKTRAQILKVLETDSLEELHDRTKALWDANYVDTPVIKSLPANSIWLSDTVPFKEDALQSLADHHYSWAFWGNMESEEMNELYRKWIDENTGSLMQDQTRDISLDARTVLGIVSAIYFKAAWNEKFKPSRTDNQVFHGAEGDTEVSMMHRDEMMAFYKTDQFQAAGLTLCDGGTMYFFLPAEGTDVKQIVTDPDAMRICRGRWEGEISYPFIHLSVPKFRAGSRTDLLDSLKALGITDAMDAQKADFSPLVEHRFPLWLDTADHAAFVEIDEEGISGAAYTELAICGAGLPEEEVDFNLDRPFYFAVVSPDGSFLFSGIVQTIDGAGTNSL